MSGFESLAIAFIVSLYHGPHYVKQIRPLASGNKYPPAEPEVLRLLAPQRGLIATGESQKQDPVSYRLHDYW